jgi:NTE family protein
LIFEGGGIRGCAYSRIPEVLQEFEILGEISKVAGSSAGAIMAVLLALKYDPNEIKNMMIDVNFADFKDNIRYIMYPYNILFKSGIYPGTKFELWVKSKIAAKTGNELTTFAELFEKNNIELVITGTSLTTGSVKYFSYKTTPDMPIWLACRISISIPFFFMPVKYDGHVYADGGILYNYPIWVFDNPQSYEYDSDKLDFVSERTLGFKLVSSSNCDFVSSMPKILPCIEMFYMLFHTFMKFVDSSYVQKTYWDRTVGINTEDVSTAEFDVSKDKKDSIILNGYLNTKQYLENKIESLSL